MKVFLSFASPDRRKAQRIQLALLGSRHQVFFDDTSLPPGGDYNTQISKAIDACDLFVVLISPHYTAKQRYAHSELKIAQAKWPKPWGHLLPVLVGPTNLHNVDPYLVSATILEPSGDIAAEVAAAIDRMAPTTDDLWGQWSWRDDGIDFIITFRADGTFIASSEPGVGLLGSISHFNGIWNITSGQLSVTQTHWSIHGLAREHSLKMYSLHIEPNGLVSRWDFDRIVYYLVQENRKDLDMQRLSQCVAIELENVRAREGEGSLVPVHYAIRALERGVWKLRRQHMISTETKSEVQRVEERAAIQAATSKRISWR